MSEQVTATELWAAIRQRDANINAFFAALNDEVSRHGDPNGSLGRLREKLYVPTQRAAPIDAFAVMRDHFGLSAPNAED